MESFFGIKNFKSCEKVMESFFSINNFRNGKKVTESFFSIKNIKSRKAVMDFFLSFRSFKSSKKVAESFSSDHASLSFLMMHEFPGTIFSLSVPNVSSLLVLWLYISFFDYISFDYTF